MNRTVRTGVYKGEIVRSVHIDWEGESGYDYYILPKRVIKKATRHLENAGIYDDDELAGLATTMAFPSAYLAEHYGGPGQGFRNYPSVLRYGRHVVIVSRWGYDI